MTGVSSAPFFLGALLSFPRPRPAARKWRARTKGAPRPRPGGAGRSLAGRTPRQPCLWRRSSLRDCLSSESPFGDANEKEQGALGEADPLSTLPHAWGQFTEGEGSLSCFSQKKRTKPPLTNVAIARHALFLHLAQNKGRLLVGRNAAPKSGKKFSFQ